MLFFPDRLDRCTVVQYNDSPDKKLVRIRPASSLLELDSDLSTFSRAELSPTNKSEQVFVRIILDAKNTYRRYPCAGSTLKRLLALVWSLNATSSPDPTLADTVRNLRFRSCSALFPILPGPPPDQVSNGLSNLSLDGSTVTTIPQQSRPLQGDG